MVAIFTGAGTGFERGSGNVIGGGGLLGSAAQGRGGDNVFLNAANGNLLISRQDEFLSGRGPDVGISRTYNSLGNFSDDNGDNWRQSMDRRVFGLTGTANTSGSKVKRRGGDGAEISYDWNGSAYVATDGSGSYDKLTYDGTNWTWTDGDSRTTEVYSAYGSEWRIASQTDTSGNSLTFSYTGANLTRVTTADGGYTDINWSGSNITSLATYSHGTGLTRTRYGYDGYNRLSTVTVDLTPNDHSVSDGGVYTTSYTYHGTSKLVATISQTDGSHVAFGYDGANRVTSIAETVSSGVTRTTGITYGIGYTTVTDPMGQVTRLDYADADFAQPIGTWPVGAVTREDAAIGGVIGTKFTMTAPGEWGGIHQQFSFAAGETITFGLTLQASGAYTTHDMGLWSHTTGYAGPGISSARIVSGPGTLEQRGAHWSVVGLSTTEPTRIEITRIYDHAGTGGAYIYVDNVGGHRAGASVIAADATLTRSMTATTLSLIDMGNWGYGGVNRTPAGTIHGSPAYQFTSLQTGEWAGVSSGISAKKGDRYSFSLSMKAMGSATSQFLGLWGNQTGWGDNSTATARIVSGPGTLIRYAGGGYTIDGLSASQETRVEIIRVYDRDEVGGAYVYADLPGGYRTGEGLIAGAPLLTKQTTTGAAGQLTRITTGYGTAQAQVTQFAYNDAGDLISVTDAAGQATSYTYDGNGNVLTATDRLGNVVTRTYNAANQVVTETRMASDRTSANASQTTRYVYDGLNQLVYTVSAEGYVTRNWYDSYGQHYWTNDFPDHVYDVSALASTATISQATLDNWSGSLGDTSSAQITYSVYDARGNLAQLMRGSQNTNFGNIGWEGYSHAFFTYDQAGQLLNRVTATQNTEHFAYDGLGRVTSSTDLNGGVTNIYFNDAATQTTVTLAGGLVQVSTYSKAGDLLSVTEGGAYATGGTANNVYDKNGRLRVTTDATGVTHYYLYDATGRKTAEVNESGDLIEYRYDARNRLVATARFALQVTNPAHLAALADANSSIDVATIRPAGHAWDVWTWQVYDADGRVLQAIDGDGSTTSYEYDASGQLIRTTGYFNKLTAAQVAAFKVAAPTGVVLPTADTRDAIARVFYDKDGRTIGALDGAGYLTRIAYDRAGRKVKEVAYAKATDPGLRASGTFQQLTDSTNPNPNPANRQMNYVYDGQGLLRYQIDGLGQVTEYGYESEVAYGSIGLVRKVTTYATAISFPSGLTFAAVKAAIASSGAAGNTANRTSWAVYDTAGRVA